MKSSPASSACLATARQSGQLADQRSGTFVAERPDEQLAPNRPILSALPLYMATRFCIDATGASTAFSVCRSCGGLYRISGPAVIPAPAYPHLVTTGHSRWKNGVASLAYDPAVHAEKPLALSVASLQHGLP